ncbi:MULTISPECIES: GlxA family transcriptional regulator [Chromohalobacter]|uniref:GlxA family transcriptional regulator n=1 Tax=Chromohalobacter TaxID=42054 RepID=UPI000558E733|nr:MULTISPECIES: GlxA family transcriptional regulator [Chromohalobacter]MDF9435810.1 GlxA family transcriptional regulator [Chromohalobacter israelensis]NWO57502.1 GlxA family transcriptional regulator [Chromohalobacter salexigens]PWW37766.1 AraC family transcriptional regulator with amidase-like domain [Chromohalobacter salexigens]
MIDTRRPTPGPERIAILLMPQFSFAGLGAMLDPLFIVNWLTQESRFKWQLLGSDATVAASNGVPLNVDTEWPAPADLDSVFVLASFETKTYTGDKRIAMWLRQCAAAGVALGGIEMGSEVLAAAGVLDEHQVAVHWDNLEGFRELYPRIQATSDLYRIAGQRLSCAGGTAVLDMMFAWLTPRVEPPYMEELRNHLLERRQRRDDSEQLSAAPEHHVETSAQLRKVIRTMRRTLETPLSAPALAALVGLSPRQLERRFKAELGVTPIRYYLWLRINRAHRLLQQTDLSVAEVASCAGFGSLEHFSRAYRRFFGCAPSDDRLQSRDAPVVPVRLFPIKR